jgi:hypothetical protein
MEVVPPCATFHDSVPAALRHLRGTFGFFRLELETVENHR